MENNYCYLLDPNLHSEKNTNGWEKNSADSRISRIIA